MTKLVERTLAKTKPTFNRSNVLFQWHVSLMNHLIVRPLGAEAANELNS